MKKILVFLKAVEYGSVLVEVPDDYSEDDVINAAHEAEENGMAHWNSRDVETDGYEEN